MTIETETPRRRRGRPRTYMARSSVTAAVAARVGRGESLRSIFSEPEAGMPSRSLFLDWLRRDPDLAQAYRIARKLHAQGWTPTPGRPVRYNPAAADAICEAVAAGYGMDDICAKPGMPSHTSVYRWQARHVEFARKLAAAREANANRLFEEALTIADNATEASWRKDKLRIDTIRWTVAKLAPQRYGAHPTVETEPARKFWNVYVQQFGQPRESAVLVDSYELDPKGGKLAAPDPNDDDNADDWAL